MNILNAIFNRVNSVGREFRYRISRTGLAYRAIKRHGKGAATPCMIQIQTVDACNGSCVMCPRGNLVKDHNRGKMDRWLFEKIIQEVAALKGPGLLVLTLQNEPFIDERLEEFIHYARSRLSKEWKIEITTNGSMLNQDRINALREAAPDVVNISINAACKDTYEKIMPGFSWDDLIFNVEHLIQCKGVIEVILRFVCISYNADESRAFKALWRATGVPVIVYDCNDRLGSLASYNDLSPPVSRMHNFLRTRIALRCFPVCPFPYLQMNILSDGTVLMCCHDYEKNTIVGDVTENTLANIFNSPAYENYRKPGHCLCSDCRFHSHALWF